MTDFKELVYRGVESDVLDYKAPVDWNLLTKQQKAKFVRHALAFANTRGGAIVIGVREDTNGRPSLYEGLTDEQCHSFDPSTVTTYINSHVDPAINITVERPLIDGKVFAILLIEPFSDIPHVALHSIDEELQNGVFYIRTASASSRAASRAGEMHELIRRALRNQRELLGKLLREVLGDQAQTAPLSAPSPQEVFPPEYDESVDYFAKRINEDFPENTPVLDIAFMPGNDTGKLYIPMTDLRKACQQALTNAEHGDFFLNSTDTQASYATNVSMRGISKSRDRFWQLFQNGLMHFRCVLPHRLEFCNFSEQLTLLMELAGAFYQQKIFNTQELHCRLVIEHSNDMVMDITSANEKKTSVCRIDSINLDGIIEIDTLIKQPQLPVKNIMEELLVRFNAPSLQE